MKQLSLYISILGVYYVRRFIKEVIMEFIFNTCPLLIKLKVSNTKVENKIYSDTKAINIISLAKAYRKIIHI